MGRLEDCRIRQASPTFREAMKETEHGYNRNSKEPSSGNPKDGKGIIQEGMEAIGFPPGADNRMRRRMSIWGISSSPCGKARSPKSRRTGRR